jgi:hypothetical protein
MLSRAILTLTMVNEGLVLSDSSKYSTVFAVHITGDRSVG